MIKHLLKYLYSKKEQKIYLKDGLVKVYSKIYFLGMKIKHKKYEYYTPQIYINNLLNNFLNYYWQVRGINDKDFYNFLIYFVNSGAYNKDIAPVIISVMLEYESYANAEYLLNKYIKEYGEDGLSEYLLIAKFMIDKKLTKNEDIQNSSLLYDILKEAEDKNSIEKFLRGRTICVVGNFPSELNKNNGTNIDKNDVVIRFNDFPIGNEYIADYGSKTNVWVVANNFDFSAVKIVDRNLSDLSILWLVSEINGKAFSKEFVNNILDIHKKYPHLCISPICKDTKKILTSKYNLRFMTSGFYVLAYLLNNFEKINAFGFSFLDENFKTNTANRYYEKRESFYSLHDFFNESRILKELYYNEKPIL